MGCGITKSKHKEGNNTDIQINTTKIENVKIEKKENKNNNSINKLDNIGNLKNSTFENKNNYENSDIVKPISIFSNNLKISKNEELDKKENVEVMNSKLNNSKSLNLINDNNVSNYTNKNSHADNIKENENEKNSILFLNNSKIEVNKNLSKNNNFEQMKNINMNEIPTPSEKNININVVDNSLYSINKIEKNEFPDFNSINSKQGRKKYSENNNKIFVKKPVADKFITPKNSSMYSENFEKLDFTTKDSHEYNISEKNRILENMSKENRKLISIDNSINNSNNDIIMTQPKNKSSFYKNFNHKKGNYSKESKDTNLKHDTNYKINEDYNENDISANLNYNKSINKKTLRNKKDNLRLDFSRQSLNTYDSNTSSKNSIEKKNKRVTNSKVSKSKFFKDKNVKSEISSNKVAYKSKQNEKIVPNSTANINIINKMKFQSNGNIEGKRKDSFINFYSNYKDYQNNIIINKENFINLNNKSVDSFYTFKERIGTGSYGKVFRAIHKKNKQEFAIKIIKKEIIKESFKDNSSFHSVDLEFKNEINSLISSDHPGIMKVFEYFIDSKNYYIVMEYIKGKDLLTFVSELKKFDEKIIANIFEQLMSAVSYLHSKDIVHRDIKPENIILTYLDNNNNQKNGGDINLDENFKLTLIDFGNSILNNNNKNGKMNSLVGTPYYIAPEVIEGNYNNKCDVWSCGVILYYLLIGKPPFKGKNIRDTFSKITNFEISFTGNKWNNISQEAKQLLSSMIDYNPENRISSKNVLMHPFIQKYKNKNLVYNRVTLDGILENIKNKNIEEKFKKATLTFIIHSKSNNYDFNELEKMFKNMDLNGDGKLSIAEVQSGFEKLFKNSLTDIEIKGIIEDMDLDKNNFIEYNEFLTAFANTRILINDNNLKMAFEKFDSNGDGFIDLVEMKSILGNAKEDYLSALIEVIDENNDGKISFEEFKHYMNEVIKIE